MKVNATKAAQQVKVTADGKGVTGHVGSLLLAEVADHFGLTVTLSAAMAHTRQRRSAHDPGVVLAQLAVMLADGGDCVSDLATLRDQPELFGHVASTPTAWAGDRLHPVGVGKTFLATALGHAGIRRRYSVHFERCDRMLHRLRTSRLDNSHDAEVRKLLRVDLLIIDDFALQALDASDPADVYELIVERHRSAPTVVTSNREPVEWLGLMADPLFGSVRHRPAAVGGLRAGHRRRVLSAPTEARAQHP